MFKSLSGWCTVVRISLCDGLVGPDVLHRWNITRRTAKRFYESSICADRIKYLVASTVNTFDSEMKNWLSRGRHFLFFFFYVYRDVGCELAVGSRATYSTASYTIIIQLN